MSQLVETPPGHHFMDSPEEANHKLEHEHAHCHETQPRVETVEVHLLQSVMGVEDGEESEGDARNSHGMEEHVDELHIDVFHASTQAID